METALILGLFIAFLFHELFGLSPGGLVVPGYIGFFLFQPERVALTLLFSLLTLLGLRACERVTLLYGRRKFFVALLLGALLPRLVGSAVPALAGATASSIGVIVPGLIARDMDNQGVVTTLLALLLAAMLVRMTLDLFLRVGLL